ncbi:hypothetical protein EEE13_07165 [Neisseria gonorrhoeae]
MPSETEKCVSDGIFPSIRIRNVFEIQHKQIPKQRRGGCTEQYPCADFGDFAQDTFLPAAKEAVDNQRDKCEKEKNTEKSAYHVGKRKVWFGRGGMGKDVSARQAACPTVSKSHAVCDIITLFAAFVGTGYESKYLGGHCNAPKNSV